MSALEEHIRGIMLVVEGGQGALMPRDQWPAPLIRLLHELEAASKADAAMMRSSSSPDRKSDKKTLNSSEDHEALFTSDEGSDQTPLDPTKEELREDRGSSSSIEEALKLRSNRGSLSDNRLLVSERKVVDLSLQVEALRARLEEEVERGREVEEEARVRFESARASWIKVREIDGSTATSMPYIFAMLHVIWDV